MLTSGRRRNPESAKELVGVVDGCHEDFVDSLAEYEGLEALLGLQAAAAPCHCEQDALEELRDVGNSINRGPHLIDGRACRRWLWRSFVWLKGVVSLVCVCEG